MTRPSVELRSAFGEIDIYLFDQLARGRFDHRRRVLDAGCGEGRNLVYFLRNGFICFGVDRDATAVTQVRALAARLAPALPLDHFVAGEIDALPWPDGSMDAVIASAVLHFARDESHFSRMVEELGRVLAPGGFLLARLASTIGLEATLGNVAGTRAALPDGSVRFVVDEAMLIDWTDRLGGRLLDPIKTTNVQGQRCMTTWCVEKKL
ncbi:MAG: class I SAM-dependent methyltransferase [Acidobacteria bacterium]|nr:class I SAM-dependent methyltransferase [Acidobacteriota bacterium]